MKSFVTGIGVLFISMIISFHIANNLDPSEKELGGLANLYVPFFNAGISVLLFIILRRFTKSLLVQSLAVIILSFLNIMCGWLLYKGQL